MYKIIGLGGDSRMTVLDTFGNPLTGAELVKVTAGMPGGERIPLWLDTNPQPGEWIVVYGMAIVFRLPEDPSKWSHFKVRR